MASISGSGAGPSSGGSRGPRSYYTPRASANASHNQYHNQYQHHETPKPMSAAAAKLERRRRGEVKRVPESTHYEGHSMSSASSMPNLLDSNQMSFQKTGNPFLPDLGSSRNLSQSVRSLNSSTGDLQQRQGSLHRSWNDLNSQGGSRNDLHRSAQDVNGISRSRSDVRQNSQDGRSLNRSWTDLCQNADVNSINGLNGSRDDLRQSSQDVRSFDRSRDNIKRSVQDVNLNRSRNDINRSMQDVNGLNRSRQDLNRSQQDLNRSSQDVNAMNRSQPDIYRSSQNTTRGSRNDLHRSQQDLYNSQSDFNRRQDHGQRSSDVHSVHGSKNDLNRTRNDQHRTDISRSVHDVRNLSSSRDDISKSWNNTRGYDKNISRSAGNINTGSGYIIPQNWSSARDVNSLNQGSPGISASQSTTSMASSQGPTAPARRGFNQSKRGRKGTNINSRNNTSAASLATPIIGPSAGTTSVQNDARGYDKNISRSAGNINTGNAYSVPQNWASARDITDPVNVGVQREPKSVSASQSTASMASSSQGPVAPARRGFNQSGRGCKGANINSQNNASASSLAAPVAGTSAAVTSAAGTSAAGTSVQYKSPVKTPEVAGVHQKSAYKDNQADLLQNGVQMRKPRKPAPVAPERPMSHMSERSYNSVSQDLRQSRSSLHSELSTAQIRPQIRPHQADAVSQDLHQSHTSLYSEPQSSSGVNQPRHADSIMNITQESRGMTPAASMTTLAFSELDDDDNKALLNKAISTWSLLSNGALVPGLPFRTVRFVLPMANLILMSVCAIFVSLSLGDSYWLEAKDGTWWFGLDGMFNGQCEGNIPGDDGLAKGSFAMVILSFVGQVVTLVGAILTFTLTQGYIRIYTVPRLEKWSLIAALISAAVSAFLLIIAAAMFSSLKIVTSLASLTNAFILAIVAIITMLAAAGVLVVLMIRQRKHR